MFLLRVLNMEFYVAGNPSTYFGILYSGRFLPEALKVGLMLLSSCLAYKLLDVPEL